MAEDSEVFLVYQVSHMLFASYFLSFLRETISIVI